VEIFHGGHLAPLLRVLDSVENRDGLAADPAHGEEFQNGGELEPGEPVGLDRVAVEEVQDILVVGGLEAEGSDEIGHAERIAAHGESDEHENEPEEGSGSGECGAESEDDLPPV